MVCNAVIGCFDFTIQSQWSKPAKFYAGNFIFRLGPKPSIRNTKSKFCVSISFSFTKKLS